MLGVTVPDIHRSLDKAAQATMIPAARVRGIYIDAAQEIQLKAAAMRVRASSAAPALTRNRVRRRPLAAPGRTPVSPIGRARREGRHGPSVAFLEGG